MSSNKPLPRKPYPTDVSDEEWAFIAPYLTLLDEAALQRRYALRAVFNAVRWIVRAGAPCCPKPSTALSCCRAAG
jgi:transposase